MNILILGGKRFLGIALVEAALKADHTPTLFNRGLTNPEMFPLVENLIGDRDGDLKPLFLHSKKEERPIMPTSFTAGKHQVAYPTIETASLALTKPIRLGPYWK